jgi:hypothetical protein
MKCIQHSRHGTVFRMPNEDAHLLVSSGRYVYVSKFEARDAALSPRRPMWKRVLLVAAAVVAMLFALALVGANAAQARPCESLAQVQKKHPGQYARYRSVDGRKCWYVGKRVPAKSEFSLPATASSRGGVVARGAQQPSPKRQDANGFAPILTAVAAAPREATYEEQINDAFLALCGGTCPQLMAFEDRWDIAMGKRR